MTMTPAEMKEFGVTLPLTQDELPYSDGEPMASQAQMTGLAISQLQELQK